MRQNRPLVWLWGLALAGLFSTLLMAGTEIAALPALMQTTAQATGSVTEPVTATPIALPSPLCVAPAKPTTAQTEGPFYKAGSPERASLLEPGLKGVPILITGYVLATDCTPIAHAWLDFWQADASGKYDNQGYRLRGHLYTDQTGQFTLTTIMPGEYSPRTVHIHVKIQALGGPVFTTQFYFPNVAANGRDTIFSPDLVLSLLDTQSGKIVTATPLAKSAAIQSPTPAATQDVNATPVIYTINVVVKTR
ncbi:MAG TPA: hypothetical protein VKQ72_05600 [Aggregatilineales bacterium]|nr:hypothetical protein [Aggregatilineales bacterium]